VKLYLQSRQLEYELLDQWNGVTVFIKRKGRHRKQTKYTAFQLLEIISNYGMGILRPKQATVVPSARRRRELF